MYISPIKNSQNFKGLWGQTTQLICGNEFTSLTYITKPYYPFKDETKESIASVSNYNRDTYHANWYDTGGTYVDEKTDVEVQKALNFTENEYSKYKKSGIGATKPEEVIHPVEKELIDRGLYKYLNKSQTYINEINLRASYKYRFVNFIKKISQKLKTI